MLYETTNANNKVHALKTFHHQRFCEPILNRKNNASPSVLSVLSVE